MHLPTDLDDLRAHANDIALELAATTFAGLQRYDTPHPVFHGCWDWHSACHGFWAILDVARLTDDKKLKSFAETRLDRAALGREVEYLAAHPDFELPYGRAWSLQLWRTWSASGGDDRLDHLAAVNAKVIAVHLESGPFRLGLHEYKSHCWAAYHALKYADAKGSEGLRERIVATCPSPPDWLPDLALDYDQPWFFSLWGQVVLLYSAVLPRPAFLEWLVPFVEAAEARPQVLEPVQHPMNSHHMAMNASRAWSLAFVGHATGRELWLHASLAHLRHSLALHNEWKDDFKVYGHWIPQFSIFALLRILKSAS